MDLHFDRSSTEHATANLFIQDIGKFRGKLKVTSNFRDKRYNEELLGLISNDENGGDLLIPTAVAQAKRYRMHTDWPLITTAFNDHIGNKGEPMNPFVSFPQAYAKIERYALNLLRAE